jgi:hypothetical protein
VDVSAYMRANMARPTLPPDERDEAAQRT